tara:strand:+ start:305 stop:757 length:453 start_codon:yes stop_codon:yes gene_type:complete
MILSEQEKNRIRGLHKIEEQRMGGMSSDEESNMVSKEEISDELVAIYSYLQDGSNELALAALENLLYGLGRFNDDMMEGKNTLKESGHMDIPSAIRKCKLILDDADDILDKLGELQEVGGELPSWWMDKITIAADYLNKADDYINTSSRI